MSVLLIRWLILVCPSGLTPRDVLTHWPLTPTTWVVYFTILACSPNSADRKDTNILHHLVTTTCILPLSEPKDALPHTGRKPYLTCECHLNPKTYSFTFPSLSLHSPPRLHTVSIVFSLNFNWNNFLHPSVPNLSWKTTLKYKCWEKTVEWVFKSALFQHFWRPVDD